MPPNQLEDFLCCSNRIPHILLLQGCNAYSSSILHSDQTNDDSVKHRPVTAMAHCTMNECFQFQERCLLLVLSLFLQSNTRVPAQFLLHQALCRPRQTRRLEIDNSELKCQESVLCLLQSSATADLSRLFYQSLLSLLP